MITQAIQTTLKSIITSYARMAPEEVKPPFAVHDENPVPEYTKEGIAGYTVQVRILVIAQTIGVVDTKSQQIKVALESMRGQTIDDTIIEEVFYESEDSDYDINTGWHVNQLNYTIETTNR